MDPSVGVNPVKSPADGLKSLPKAAAAANPGPIPSGEDELFRDPFADLAPSGR